MLKVFNEYIIPAMAYSCKTEIKKIASKEKCTKNKINRKHNALDNSKSMDHGTNQDK